MSCNNCNLNYCDICNRKEDGMTVKKMRRALNDFCNQRIDCSGCPFGSEIGISGICEFDEWTDDYVRSLYIELFGSIAHTEESIRENTEEINHPSRYKGKYECIEVMRDTFGDTAVKDFCRLNAFKYLWRSEKKNGIEDIRKAAWYLDYLIGMEEENGKD